MIAVAVETLMNQVVKWYEDDTEYESSEFRLWIDNEPVEWVIKTMKAFQSHEDSET